MNYSFILLRILPFFKAFFSLHSTYPSNCFALLVVLACPSCCRTLHMSGSPCLSAHREEGQKHWREALGMWVRLRGFQLHSRVTRVVHLLRNLWFRTFKSFMLGWSCSPEQSSDLFFGIWGFWESCGIRGWGSSQYSAFNRQSLGCYWEMEHRLRGRQLWEITFHLFLLISTDLSKLQRPLVLTTSVPWVISLFSPLQLCTQLSQTLL